FKAGAVGIVRELRGLEQEGAKYAITPDASGKIQVAIVRPRADGDERAAQNAPDMFGAGDARRAKALAFNFEQLSTFGPRIARVREKIDWRMYGVVSDLEKVRQNQPLDFKLAGDVAPADYAQMLRVLLVSLQHDRDYLVGLEAGVVAVALTLRGA